MLTAYFNRVIGTVALVGLLLTGNSNADSVLLGVDDSLVTIDTRISKAGYRLHETRYDQRIDNAASEPVTNVDRITAQLGDLASLAGLSVDFTLTWESGDDGIRGLTFNITDGNSIDSTLIYDASNPINGMTPDGSFDGIGIEVFAGDLGDPGTASMTMTNLAYSSSLPSSGSLPDPINASTPPASSELFVTWVIGDTDLGAVDWILTGTAVGDFSCDDGTGTCLDGDSVRFAVTLADVTNVNDIVGTCELIGSETVYYSGDAGALEIGCGFQGGQWISPDNGVRNGEGHCDLVAETAGSGPFLVCQQPVATQAECDALGMVGDNSEAEFFPGDCGPFWKDEISDMDSDGVPDESDNCTEVENADQRDTDNDGFGNVCDPDFNGNGIVDPADFSLLKSRFAQPSFPDQDLNGNGIVDPFDFSLLKSMFGQPPGPSGLAP